MSAYYRQSRMGLRTRFLSSFGGTLLAPLWGLAVLLFLAGPAGLQAWNGGSGAAKTYTLDMTHCAGFTAADAAKLLNVPAAGLAVKTEKTAPNLWICSFTPPKGNGLSFSVTVAENEPEAADQMEDLRSNLEIAGGTAAFKDKLPNGAYSDIVGIGDDAVWTDVNGTLTVRKGNVIVQVLNPPGKMNQLKAAQAFLEKIK